MAQKVLRFNLSRASLSRPLEPACRLVAFLMSTLPFDNQISKTYEQLRANWVGCDWLTEFGPGRLNLNRISARQARMLANATSGQESTQWHEAAEWLTTVETDAESARQAAEAAHNSAGAGKFREALTHAQRACDIEQPHHRTAIVWEPLRNVIRLKLADLDGS